MSPITAATANKIVPTFGLTESRYALQVWNPERISVRGPCEVDETREGDKGDREKGFEIKGEIGKVVESGL